MHLYHLGNTHARGCGIGFYARGVNEHMEILDISPDGTVTIPAHVLADMGGRGTGKLLVELRGDTLACMRLTGAALSKGMAKELRGVMREKIAEEAEDAAERRSGPVHRSD